MVVGKVEEEMVEDTAAETVVETAGEAETEEVGMVGEVGEVEGDTYTVESPNNNIEEI